MLNDSENEQIVNFINGYCDVIMRGFKERWVKYKPEIYHNEISEAIGGLAARQVTLAIEMAKSPGIWNGHVAPLVLRCMTDTHITITWILTDPLPRSREYIRYGLGQEKLFIEYLQNEASIAPAGELDDRIEKIVDARKAWLDSQMMDWAIEVNVGSWSGKSTREMAVEAACEGLYKFAYVPFSGAAHSMWQHVGLYNMMVCGNPLHKGHRIPVVPELSSDPDYLYRSSKYVSRTFDLLTDGLALNCDIRLPVEYFLENEPFTRGRKSADD